MTPSLAVLVAVASGLAGLIGSFVALGVSWGGLRQRVRQTEQLLDELKEIRTSLHVLGTVQERLSAYDHRLVRAERELERNREVIARLRENSGVWRVATGSGS